MGSYKRTYEELALKFQLGDRIFLLSKHAYERIQERFNCPFEENIQKKVEEAIKNGYFADFKMARKATLNLPNEEVLTYQDMNLHIRENTIVTAKVNMAFFGSVHSNSSRSLKRGRKFATS